MKLSISTIAALVICLAVNFGSSAAAKKSSDKGGPCRAPLQLKHKNSSLQRELSKALKAKGWQKYLDSETMGVSVLDLSDSKRMYYAGVNDDKMFYAASLPKIAILLTVVEEANNGKIEWNHTHDKRLQNMIVASSNADASWGVDLVGLLAIEDVMRSPKYCFYNKKNGGLWVGRPYRRGGASNRDPIFNISHGSSAKQATRFYGLLHMGKLVNPHWSFRMLGLMSPPKHYHKFVGGLKNRNGVVFLARKSGSWRNFHADSALIQRGNLRYVIVGLSELKKGEQIMRELAQVVDDIIVKGDHRKGRRRKK